MWLLMYGLFLSPLLFLSVVVISDRLIKQPVAHRLPESLKDRRAHAESTPIELLCLPTGDLLDSSPS
ncbi:MAG TPA: hypothetical protein VJ692_05790 [Nitrospiraceae bacterium]|nr:hypothetical protein [Nitrospiraceae bacterium]